jgi:hypothetical protein
MSHLFKAAAAFVLVALISGSLTLGPRWRVVAEDIHQAQPQAKVMAELRALFAGEKG